MSKCFCERCASPLPQKAADKVCIGEMAPTFSATAVMPNGDVEKITLDQYRGKWLILFSYPLDFSPVCQTELDELTENYEQFEANTCDILAMSVDSILSHKQWRSIPREEGGIKGVRFPLISDLGGNIAKKYGWYLRDHGHTCRGTAIISPDGVLKYYSMASLDVGRNGNEAIRLLQALNFTERENVETPANWKPHKKAIPSTNIWEKTVFYDDLPFEC